MFSWTILLFILCSALTPALCCDWLTHYTQLSSESLRLLQQMGGELTEQESPVTFPKKLYRRIHGDERESQLVFIRDSLELISDLYSNFTSSTLDATKTEHFLTIIHRQADELNGCVSTKKRADKRLRKYYKRLARRTLYRTGGSAASWELIRKETKLHLDQLHMLVTSIRHAAVTPTQQQH
ncbi:interferon a3-like [Dicentrarchus labrax]|uniref:Uncharacterized protein n=1 Tax=Dicentrarchus labrax TaxID=13489 RepID=A0A8C4DSR8_DICLA|nr:interferon a3-like [Dicentrarchus labrax]